ncbi:MAG: DeoR/GlpR family DNA-binding transcription regulator [Oscillospiraceae bacterium]|nr:DeoR/GlpR family DNA-binding transcription regulator [Oscillospiraceae bacterium]
MKKDRQSVDARRIKVLSMIRERQKIKVEELAAYFNVSLMTIRRDLQILEEKGLVGRFYGGATVDFCAAPVSERDSVALYRQLIARYAAALVMDGDNLFINGSSTALSLLDYVGEKTVHVFTNNGAVVNREFPAGVEITLSGGTLRGQSHILTGDCAMRNLLMAQAENAFMGCSGISPDGEILCGIPTELGINETMISHARRYYILADYTKIGKTGTYASFSLEKTGTIITDEMAPAAVVEQLRTIGMTVVQVKRSDFPNPSEDPFSD